MKKETFGNSRNRSHGDSVNGNVGTYDFRVSFTTYKLALNPDRYSEKQQHLYDLVMHLKSEGMGYRKVAKYLNGMGHKTHTGKTFTPSSIQFIIKRNQERIQRKALIDTEEKLIYSNLKINLWNEEEL